jgi:hypothetical protein
MPKLTKKPYIPPKEIELTCAACGVLKKNNMFYISYNPIHTTNRIPYCKACLKKMICDENGNVTLDKLQSTLQLIDRPFICDLWKISLEDKMDTFGCYMKNLCLKQNRQLTWKDSVFKPQLSTELNYDNSLDIEYKNNNISLKQSEFILTDEIIDKWGAGYKTEEYQAFERKYHLLKNNYPEKTAMHTEALLNYIRYRVKEEMSTASGQVKEAKEWGGLAKDAATAAKINPSQLSKADLTEGLSTFSELVRAVEQSVDIIPILPKFKEKPQDKVDFTLWCYINYIRDLKGLPPCEYKDIWQFYEDRKNEYIQHSNKEDNIFENENGDE